MNPQFVFNIGVASAESGARQGGLPEPADLATIAGGVQATASARISLPTPVDLTEIGSTALQQTGAGLPSPAPVEAFASATGATPPSPEPLAAFGVVTAFDEPPTPLPMEQVLAAAEPGLGLKAESQSGLRSQRHLTK